MKSNLMKKYCPYCGNKLIRKLIEGRKRLFCNQCERVYYENPTPVVAVVARDETKRILLIKRKLEPGKGEWALPSGFMELEESPEEAALRELKEETGMMGKCVGLIGIYTNKSEVHGYLVNLIYEVKITGGDICAGDDAAEAKFFSPNQVPFLVFRSHQKALTELLK